MVFKDDQFQLEEFSEDYEAAIGYLCEEARALLTTYEADGAQPENLYAMAFQGFSVELTEEKKNQLQKDARVKSIEPDRIRVLGTL
ncbi:protease inhibitor I9 family protein [Arthrospiribacter ruber]|uniref:protease inhibitor I9 family protein n=1 Tax=Arthrospiribacter ruber TaxID=2487934 RepID=UPI001C5A7E81